MASKVADIVVTISSRDISHPFGHTGKCTDLPGSLSANSIADVLAADPADLMRSVVKGRGNIRMARDGL